MAAPDKVDAARGHTPFPNAEMFRPVSDLMAVYDLEKPANSYEKSFAKWREESEEAIQTYIEEGGVPVDETSTDAALQIGYGILEKFLKRGTAVGWGAHSVEARRQALDQLLALPQVPQRTYEWYMQGKQVLTASEFSNIFGTPRAVRNLAFQKVVPPADTGAKLTNRLACPTTEMGPFDWGVRFEPVVKQVLSQRWGCKIVDTGRIMHPTDPLLAASPDGIIYDAVEPQRVGRLLEIKCPITRLINETIPFEYWCQMQIQMEVTGIDECEYVEVKIQSATAKGGAVDMIPEGHVWLLHDSATEKMTYAYTEEEKASFQEQGFTELEMIPWRVEKLFTKTVVRDRGWFEGTRAKREEFWAIVAQARRGEIQPFEVKSKQKLTVNVLKEGVCYITDDAVGSIQPVLGTGSVLYTESAKSCMGAEQESGSPLL
jgi:hypothetical protein